MHATTAQTFARGTIASIERARNRTGAAGEDANGQIITGGQLRTTLEQENAILRDQLRLARERIRELESQLAVRAVEPDNDRLVNMTEAAAMLDVHPSTVSRWVAAGHFKLHQSGHRKKPLIYLSSLKRPARKKRGRKARHGA